MLLRLVGVDARSFADGFDVGAALVDSFPVRDPRLLRSGASSLESRATTMLEFGVAAALRAAAEDAAGVIEAQRRAYVALLDALELNDAPRVEVAS